MCGVGGLGCSFEVGCGELAGWVEFWTGVWELVGWVEFWGVVCRSDGT